MIIETIFSVFMIIIKYVFNTASTDLGFYNTEVVHSLIKCNAVGLISNTYPLYKIVGATAPPKSAPVLQVCGNQHICKNLNPYVSPIF